MSLDAREGGGGRESSPEGRRWPGETFQGAKRPSIYMFLEGRLVFDANKPSKSRRFTFFGADASHRRVLERVVCSCSTIERRVLRVFTWVVGGVAWESGHGAWLTLYHNDVRICKIRELFEIQIYYMDYVCSGEEKYL